MTEWQLLMGDIEMLDYMDFSGCSTNKESEDSLATSIFFMIARQV